MAAAPLRVCWVCWVLGVLCVSGWLAVASGRLGRFCVRLLGWLGGALVLAWGCFGAGLGVLWAGFGVAGACVVIPCLRSYACWAGLGVLWCWLGLCGGNCYHRRCVAACRRRVGGLWSQNPPLGWKGQRRVLFRWLCWLCSACLRVFVVVVWLVFVGGLGGIATIGAALRRVAGVSVVYGRKTPRGCLEGPVSRAL